MKQLTVTLTVLVLVGLTEARAEQINLGSPTKFGMVWNHHPNTQYPNNNTFGWDSEAGSDRRHLVMYYDLSDIISTREPDKQFEVTNTGFAMYTSEVRHYWGPEGINPILVDWVSGAVPATWNNIEGSGTGSPGIGPQVAVGYPDTGEMKPTWVHFASSETFNRMLEDWLNEVKPNYGFIVRATGGAQPGRVDGYGSFTTGMDYRQIIPEPSTLALLCIGAIGLLVCVLRRIR